MVAWMLAATQEIPKTLMDISQCYQARDCSKQCVFTLFPKCSLLATAEITLSQYRYFYFLTALFSKSYIPHHWSRLINFLILIQKCQLYYWEIEYHGAEVCSCVYRSKRCQWKRKKEQRGCLESREVGNVRLGKEWHAMGRGRKQCSVIVVWSNYPLFNIPCTVKDWKNRMNEKARSNFLICFFPTSEVCLAHTLGRVDLQRILGKTKQELEQS